MASVRVKLMYQSSVRPVQARMALAQLLSTRMTVWVFPPELISAQVQ
jgi:hypothetical protein